MSATIGNGIALGNPFDVNANVPSDSRETQPTIAARNAIVWKYDGLECYVESEKSSYKFILGYSSNSLLDNGNWAPLSEAEPDVVAAGTYTKVTVTSKGRVISGSNITTADVGGLIDIGTGRINQSLMPAISIIDTFVRNSELGMLALDAQQGDICVRTDLNKSFILTTDDPTQVGNWQELISSSGSVTSVSLSMPATEFDVSNPTITTSGTFGVTWKSQPAARVLASPVSSTGSPVFRALQVSDVVNLSAMLQSKENLVSKVTTLDNPNDSNYPTTQAVVNALDSYVTTNTSQVGLTGVKDWLVQQIFTGGISLPGIGALHASTGANAYSVILRGDGQTFYGPNSTYTLYISNDKIQFKYGNYGAGINRYTTLRGQGIAADNVVLLPVTSGTLALESQIPTIPSNLVYNDGGTYNINISGNASYLQGYQSDINPNPNTIVRRTDGGIIFGTYLYMNGPTVDAIGIADFVTTAADGYLRRSSVGAVQSKLGLGSFAYRNSIQGNEVVTDTATAGADIGVSQMLRWKNYGNSHVIFDASQGTAPDGTAISSGNSVHAWTNTYPTLMGWNGNTTYGVRVDSARNADNWGGTPVNFGEYATSANWFIVGQGGQGMPMQIPTVKSVLNISDGSTLNNNISGSAAKIYNLPVDLDTFGDGNIGYVIGYNSGGTSDGQIKAFQASQIKSWLGLPSTGAYDLQWVTSNGATTSIPITINADLRVWQDTLRFSYETSYAQIVSGTGKGFKFYIDDGASLPMVISPGGYVGINTTNPLSNFHVAGSAQIDGDITLGFNGQTNRITSREVGQTLVLGGSADLRFQTYSGGWFDRLVIANNGDIDITGSLGIGGKLYALGSGDSAASWANAGLEVRGSTNPGISFHIPGIVAAALYVSSEGRLRWNGNGIRTTFVDVDRLIAGYDSGIAGSVNSSNYFRLAGGGGITWDSYGTSITSTRVNQFHVQSNSTDGNFVLRTTSGISGNLHWNNSNEVGFLKSDESWRMRVTDAGWVYSDAFVSENWFRSKGATGWVNETYGGGIYMSDSTWVMVYGGKAFLVQNTIQADRFRATAHEGFQVADYGIGLEGIYDSQRYQSVFSMGNAYKMAQDGISLANHYGIAWTHSNIGGQSIQGLEHQALFTIAGETQTAIGKGIWTRGGIHANGTINTNGELYVQNYVRSRQAGYGLYNEVTGAHFYSLQSSGYVHKSGSNAYTQLEMKFANDTALGYLYGDGTGFGLLNNQGGWSVRLNQGSGYGGLLNGNWDVGGRLSGQDGVNPTDYVTRRQVAPLAAQGSGIRRVIESPISGVFSAAGNLYLQNDVVGNVYVCTIPAGTFSGNKGTFKITMYVQFEASTTNIRQLDLVISQNSQTNVYPLMVNQGQITNKLFKIEFEASSRSGGLFYSTTSINGGSGGFFTSSISGINFINSVDIKFKVNDNSNLNITMIPLIIEVSDL